MSHKKGQGTSRNGRDSNSKRLGVKKFGGEAVIPGTSSCANAVHVIILALASEWAVTTHSSHW